MKTDLTFAFESDSIAVVTGATGYTGRVLARKLIDCGLRIHAIARPASKTAALDGLPIRWYRGEVHDPETVRAAMQGARYVFHLAAAFREAKSTEQDYWNVHVRSTQLLAAEAQGNPNFKRMVHVSTMGVHGHIANPPANEESPFAPGDGYQRSKAESEHWLRDFARANRLPYTIIRPCGIYGPGEPRFLKIHKMALKPFFPILGGGQCWYHLVHVEDLTNAIMLAATEPKALGEAILAGGAEPIRLQDLASIVAKEFNHRLRVVRLPIWPFFILGDACEALCKPFGVEPPIYRRRVAFYSKDRYFDTSKMQRVLGYTPIYGNHRGIQESARWYREHGLI